MATKSTKNTPRVGFAKGPAVDTPAAAALTAVVGNQTSVPAVDPVVTQQKQRMQVSEIPIDSIITSHSRQPLRESPNINVQELAENIAEFGLQQPIIVSRTEKSGSYVLIAGERRLRAFAYLRAREQRENPQSVGIWGKIDAVILNADQAMSYQISVIENMQREDLSVFELSDAVKELQNMGISNVKIGGITRLSPNTITQLQRMHNVPGFIRTDYYDKPGMMSRSLFLEYVEMPHGHQRALWDLVKNGMISREHVRVLKKMDTDKFNDSVNGYFDEETSKVDWAGWLADIVVPGGRKPVVVIKEVVREVPVPVDTVGQVSVADEPLVADEHEIVGVNAFFTSSPGEPTNNLSTVSRSIDGPSSCPTDEPDESDENLVAEVDVLADVEKAAQTLVAQFEAAVGRVTSNFTASVGKSIRKAAVDGNDAANLISKIGNKVKEITAFSSNVQLKLAEVREMVEAELKK